MLRNFIFSKALIGSVLVLTLFVCVLIADPEVFADEFFVLSKLGEHPKTADIFTFGLSIGAILYGLRILLLEKNIFGD